jgi:hypothetical protein
MSRRVGDLTGQKFGRWAVLSLITFGSRWLCECECGSVRTVDQSHLISGRSRSCGCLIGDLAKARIRDLTGQTFGRLVVLESQGQDRHGKSRWLCQCSCGKLTSTITSSLSNGYTQSCGCLAAEKRAASRRTHGQSRSRKYLAGIEANRRAAQKQRTPKWADHERMTEIYLKCPDGYHVDHIVPLQGKTVSGLHVPENLQYLPQFTNQSKGNRFEPVIAFGSLQLT